MNKRNKLFMLVLFMFIGISRVNAATGLYCIYKMDNSITGYTMLVQDNHGNDAVYLINNLQSQLIDDDEDVSWDSFSWGIYSGLNYSFDVPYDKLDSDGNLLQCPYNYMTFWTLGVNDVVFSNDKGTSHDDNYLIKNGTFNDSSINANSFNTGIIADPGIYKVNSTNYTYDNVGEQWLVDVNDSDAYTQSCLYSYSHSENYYGSIQLDINFKDGKVRISFADYSNEVGYVIGSKLYGSNYSFSYLESHYSDSCPYQLYGFVDYMEYLYFSPYSKSVSDLQKAYKRIANSSPGSIIVPSVQDYVLTNSYPKVSDISIKKNPFIIDDCDDLLGTELVDILHGGVNVVKILIPIILIGLGIVDFTQASFGTKEDDMKKASSRFVRRIIIAIVIFLIPDALKILLSIADAIWGVVDPSLCGIL